VPELPEVEVVRRGLRPLSGTRIDGVEVLDERAITRHAAGAADFERRLTGALLGEPARRGKFLWVPLSRAGGAPTPSPEAMLIHLGMSGQLRLDDAPRSHRHERVRLILGERVLVFTDQRTFGSLAVDPLRPDGVDAVPSQVAHIARDPLDPGFDDRAFLRRLRAKRTEVKRALLDQTLVSGIGNIYADEALWGARVHPRQPADRLSAPAATRLLGEVRLVMERALAEGGTSFDRLYVNVNGESGYFSRSLRAYAQDGRPCGRCGTPLVREAFTNRASHFCPRCQRVR